MEEEIIQKIYSLTADLASQQKNNHELASGLSSQLAELKVRQQNESFVTNLQANSHVPFNSKKPSLDIQTMVKRRISNTKRNSSLY